MKKVWITALTKEDEGQVEKLVKTLKQYGLAPGGHFWSDDLQNMAWMAAQEELLAKETALWLIVGSAGAFGVESIRYGLSLLAITAQARRGHGFPVLVAASSGEVKVESLSTPLRNAEVISLANPSLGPKIVARANIPPKKVEAEYRLDAYGIPKVGQWLEVGPASGHTWKGAMLGVCGGEITSHAVGPSGTLPDRSVLEYPMKGLKLQMGEKEYTAWAVQNELDEGSSYYLGFKEYPSSIVFGPLPGGDDAELFALALV